MKFKMILVVLCMAGIAAVNATPLGHQVHKRQSCPPTSLIINGMEFDGSTPEDTVVQLEVLEDATFVPINITLNSTEDVLVNFSSSNATDANGTASAYYILTDSSTKMAMLGRRIPMIFGIPFKRIFPFKFRLSVSIRIYFIIRFRFLCWSFSIRFCLRINAKIAIWGDPHFTVPLLNGGSLCYSVQGIPGLPFNLLSSRHLIINALFISSVNDQTQATWIGKLTVIPQRTSKSQMITFDSVSQSIKIEGKGIFKSQFLKYISINETGDTVVKTTHGLKKQIGNPTVEVFLTNPLAAFYVTFHKDHLDIDWKVQSDEVDSSHGLMGQFMVKDVIIDPTKQLLIRPGFEPVHVKPSKNWNSPGNCWLAKNAGNQGEGLIKGSIYDYIVDTVESTNVPSF